MTAWILEKRPSTCFLESKYMKIVLIDGRMVVDTAEPGMVRPTLVRLTEVSAGEASQCSIKSQKSSEIGGRDCHRESCEVWHCLIGWPGCGAKIKRQVNATQGRDQCINPRSLRTDSSTPSSRYWVSLQKERRESTQHPVPCNASVPHGQQVHPRPGSLMGYH